MALRMNAGGAIRPPKIEVPARRGAGGVPLPDDVRRDAERILGEDLADVRIHVGPEASRLRALAFTMGSHIYFAPGWYDPRTRAGRTLLGHELAHVVQQRRGRASNRLGYGIAVVRDPVLEDEATRIGRLLASAGPARMVQLASNNDGQWADGYNRARLADAQETTHGGAQLDHMVSRDTLEAFAKTYAVLLKLTSSGDSKWELSRAQMQALRDAAPRWENNAPLMSAKYLVNIPENIFPGRKPELAGAGSAFDSLVKFTGAVNVGGKACKSCKETALSLSQRTTNQVMHKLNQLVDAELFPQKDADTKKDSFYDEDADELIAAELKKLATAFGVLAKAAVPVFDAAVWYEVEGNEETKWVKTRPADWIEDASAVAIGDDTAPDDLAEWTYRFTFATQCLRKGKGSAVKVVPVTVRVAVTVPEATWEHIYERHYLSTFDYNDGKNVKAVNTFWKDDPYEFIRSEQGCTLLQRELTQLLMVACRYSMPYDNLGDPAETADVEDDNDPIYVGQASDEANGSVDGQALFFQWSVASYLGSKDPAGVVYDAQVDLTSIAPQDPVYAYALLPSQLTEYFTEEE